jgi:predicted transposase YbfD/YdcC
VTDVVQSVELNKGRVEARALERFDVSSEQACFPFVAQAARLTRFVERKDKKSDEIETEFLACSCTAADLPAPAMFQADRDYWGIESGLNYRLDVSADEDKSRVRTRSSAFNLGLFRRAANSFAIAWIKKQRDKRKASLLGFYDDMSLKTSRKAFSLVTASKPTWLPKS